MNRRNLEHLCYGLGLDVEPEDTDADLVARLNCNLNLELYEDRAAFITANPPPPPADCPF